MKYCITFLTGQSNPQCIELSPVQRRFLEKIPTEEANKLYCNFPYRLVTSTTYKQTPILTASFNNFFQYFFSRSNSYVNKHKESFMQIFTHTEKLVLLTGSCGLELFNNLNLPQSFLEKIYIFAYGAVARENPQCNFFSIRGDKDWIAALFSLPIDHVVKATHMNYLEQDQVVAELQEKFIDCMVKIEFPLSI